MVISVKNINLPFEDIRDWLDAISPSFILEKDTFIYHSGDEALLRQLRALQASKADLGSMIVLTC